MGVTLYQGDCLDILPTLEAGSVDAVVTDPPYLVRGDKVPIRGRGVVAPTEDSFAVGLEWGYSLDWVQAVATLNPQHWIVFCNYRMLGNLQTEIERFARIAGVFVWRKSNAPRMTRNVPRLDCEFIVWAKSSSATNVRAREFTSQVLDVPMPQAGCFATERVLMPDSKKAAHPTQKPMAVILPFLNHLTEPGQTILDPFMGSGTTGVACVQTGRNFIGIEKDAGYFAIAQRRIAEAQMQLQLELV